MLKEIFSSVSKKMFIDFEEITSQINHNGEKGTARENVLQDYLRAYIPDKYQFSKGIIIDCKDTQSKQVDIIIHDKYTTPSLIDMSGTKMIPIESVYAVIEVKSTLTKEELRKSVKNINSVKTLQKNTVTGISYPTAGLIFAYDSNSSFDTIYKNFHEISQEFEPQNRASCLCVLNKGIIIPVDKHGLNKVSLLPNNETVNALISNEEDALLLFYLILMQLLTQIQVFPPDMVKYAQSGRMLDTTFNIPAEYLPEDGTIEFLNKPVTIADLKILQENSQKILSGQVKRNEFLEKFFGMYIIMFKMIHDDLGKIPEYASINYYNHKIFMKKIVELYRVYCKGEKATSFEKNELTIFEDYVYKLYEVNKKENGG